MRPRLRVLLPAAVVATAAAIGSVTVLADEDARPMANLWIDPSGGDCVREGSPGAYRDTTACATLDAAWNAALPGDTIRVKAGRYPAQSASGAKARPTRVVGEDGTVFTSAGAVNCGYQGGALCANADRLVLERVVLDAGDLHGQSSGAEVNGSGVTFRDVALDGPYVSLYVVGEGFRWQGGRLGAAGRLGGPRSPACDGGNGDGQPVWIEQTATGATLDGITVHPQAADPTPRSCSENGFHLEAVRIEAARDVTIRDVRFMPRSQAGSGHVFVTSATPSNTASRGLVIEDSVFTPVDGTYGLQAHPNVRTCAWTITGNTMAQPFLLDCDATGLVWSGNTGPSGDPVDDPTGAQRPDE